MSVLRFELLALGFYALFALRYVRGLQELTLVSAMVLVRSTVQLRVSSLRFQALALVCFALGLSVSQRTLGLGFGGRYPARALHGYDSIARRDRCSTATIWVAG